MPEEARGLRDDLRGNGRGGVEQTRVRARESSSECFFEMCVRQGGIVAQAAPEHERVPVFVYNERARRAQVLVRRFPVEEVAAPRESVGTHIEAVQGVCRWHVKHILPNVI